MTIKRIESTLVIQIKRWLEEWATGQYGKRLTWKRLEVYSGFSRQALSANQGIAKAFREAKVAIRRNFTQPRETSGSAEQAQKIDELRSQISALEAQAKNWAALWERWRYNARQAGWDTSILDREMPKPQHRKRPRH
jgi:hypothetical protein